MPTRRRSCPSSRSPPPKGLASSIRRKPSRCHGIKTRLGGTARGPQDHLPQVVRLGIPRRILSASFTRSAVDRSRTIPYSNHGVGRETRLELATLTLARYRSNSVFEGGETGL